MEKEYSIEEILSAVDDLQKIKKNKNDVNSLKHQTKVNVSEIPRNTLQLIEEAEKSKN
tara:strand:- start:1288 stop:1461 length:174 start_codon:yes stop_codon:yes gene_type:complete